MTLAEVLVAAGGALASLAAFFGGLRSGRAEFINAVAKAADQVMVRLEAEITRVTGRCEQLEHQVGECTAKHEACERESAEQRVRIERLEADARRRRRPPVR